MTDVGSGAGSISRAADTHIVIRPHEDPELCVLECVTRSFQQPELVSIRFDWPLWSDVAKDPQVKKQGQNRHEKAAKDDQEADKVLLETLAGSQKWLSESQLVRTTGMGPTRISRAIGRAFQMESVATKYVKRQGRKVAVYGPTATPNMGIQLAMIGTHERAGQFASKLLYTVARRRYAELRQFSSSKFIESVGG